MIRRILMAALLSAAPAGPAAAKSDDVSSGVDAGADLATLSAEFFNWRRIQQPASGDDIPRVERPDGWLPEYSPPALASYRAGYRGFSAAVAALDTAGWPVAERVDRRLVQAAIQRIYWELDVLKTPHRNPLFYLDQTLGSVFELLVLSSPMTEARARNILLRLEHFPAVIEAAKANLDQPVRPFARTALRTLAEIDGRLARMRDGLAPVFPPELHGRLDAAVATAVTALKTYASWLEPQLGSMRTVGSTARRASFHVRKVIVPATPMVMRRGTVS